MNDPCTSKRGIPKKRWATEAAAKFVALVNHREDGLPHDIYKCNGCGKWHTTHATSGGWRSRIGG